MRISVDRDDPGFSYDAIWYEVYLDGQYIRWCITADEERGEVTCHVMDGDMVVVEPNGESLLTEIRKGLVEIRRVDSRLH